jgi:Amt family ammonium transporter
MLFQLMFAAFTPALIAGAFAERIKFGAMLLFAGLWSVFVYTPIAPLDVGNGWLARLGAMDFAGVRWCISLPGSSAMACAIAIGKATAGGPIIWRRIICRSSYGRGDAVAGLVRIQRGRRGARMPWL